MKFNNKEERVYFKKNTYLVVVLVVALVVVLVVALVVVLVVALVVVLVVALVVVLVVALVVVLVVEAALVVVLVVEVDGLVFWQVAPLQNPVMAPLMQGTPCFLKMLSQVMAAEHLGLLLQGPILLPQIWLTLLKVHCPGTPGALQHGPPSQPSAPFLIPSPHLVTTVIVPVKDPVMDGL